MYTLIIKSDNGSADRLVQSTNIEDFLPLDQIITQKYAYGTASAILINTEGICIARWNKSDKFNSNNINVPILPDINQCETRPVKDDTDSDPANILSNTDNTDSDSANILSNIINDWQNNKAKTDLDPKTELYIKMITAIRDMANIKQVKPENMSNFIDLLFKTFIENINNN